MNIVTPDSTIVNTQQLDTDRLLLDAQYLDLKETYDNPLEIYNLLVAYNASLNNPLHQDELRKYAPPEPQEQEQAHKEDTLPLYRQAINELDVKKLYQCGDLLAQLKRISPVSFAYTCDEIREKFGKAVSWKQLNAIIAFSVRQQTLADSTSKPDVADIAQHWSMAHRDAWGYDLDAQCWRMWNDEYWEAIEDKASILDQYTVAALQEAGIPVNSSNVMNTFQRVAQSHCKRQFIAAPGKINFANGTLDLSTWLLTRYNREDNLTYCLPYCYNPQKRHPVITAFLMALIQEKQDAQHAPNIYGVQAVMAHIGLALIGDTSLQKAVMALGATGSGKSTLLDLINVACGLTPANYVPHSIFSRELEGDRKRYSHNKKRIACLDEVPSDALQDEELFKSMTAHKGVPMRGMRRDDQMDNQWKPKLFMVANDDPHYKDVSSAIKRRLLVIRTPIQRFDEPKEGQPKQNALLLESFLPELEGFVYTCLRYAIAVRRRGFYPQSATMKRDLDEIAANGNPLKACLEDKFILDPKAYTLTSELHKVYEDYCEDLGRNIKAFAKNKFSGILSGMNIGVSPKKIAGQRHLIGIRVRTEYDPEPTDESTEQNYQDSPVLDVDDPTMDDLVDGWDGWWTIEKTNRPLGECPPQADVQAQWTVGTVDLEIKHFFQEHTHTDESARVHSVIKNKTDNQPSQPSTHSLNGHDKLVDNVDGWENQPSTPSIQPSTNESEAWEDFTI